MNANHATVVQVRNAWCGWRAAEVFVKDLEDIHWFQPPGAPRSIVHAFVRCTNLRGDIPHGCAATPGPHRVLVCVLKHCVAPSVHAELARRADNRQQLTSAEPPKRSAGGRLFARTQREGAARSVPWLFVGAGGAILLGVIVARECSSRIASSSPTKRQPEAVAA